MNKTDIAAEDFTQCICLRLRKGARQTTQIYDEFLAPSGLRITQFGLLAHLQISKAPLSVSALAAELSMDPTTLNRNLKPLEKRKLVKMTLNARDRRSKVIVLTSAGRALLWKAAPLWIAAHDHLHNLLGQVDASALSETLDISLAHFRNNSVKN